jgi:hypothetical protein
MRRAAAAGCCALSLALPAGAARADDFDWLGIVYVWAADISVDSRDASANIDFDDLIEKLEMAAQTHVEVQGDDLGGFIDFTFLGVGANTHRPLAHLNTDLDSTVMDLGLVYSPGAERMTGFEAFGGLRYLDTNFHLTVQPTLPNVPDSQTRVDSTYTDLLLGARYIAPLGGDWRLTVTGDVSGIDTEGTWSLGAFAGYIRGPHHFIAGYRHMEIDLKANGSKATETMTGPVVGYGYRF